MRGIVLLGLLGGCVERAPDGVQSCYEGERCSRATPLGLEFRGTDVTGQRGGEPGAVAVGGTQRIVLLDPTEDLSFPVPFERSYRTDTSMRADPRFDLGVTVEAMEANEVIVRGVAEGFNFLRVVAPDGALYDRAVLAAHAIGSRQLRPIEDIVSRGPAPAEAVVWMPGTHEIRMALWADPRPELGLQHERLVDESLVLELSGATQTRWDTVEVAAPTVGHRQLAVTGGSGSALLDIETVAAPDAIVDARNNVYPVPTTGSQLLCFEARHGTRFVAGVTWSFEMEGGEVLTSANTDTARSGCAYFTASRRGTVQIRATASGYTQTLDVIAN